MHSRRTPESESGEAPRASDERIRCVAVPPCAPAPFTCRRPFPAVRRLPRQRTRRPRFVSLPAGNKALSCGAAKEKASRRQCEGMKRDHGPRIHLQATGRPAGNTLPRRRNFISYPLRTKGRPACREQGAEASRLSPLYPPFPGSARLPPAIHPRRQSPLVISHERASRASCPCELRK